MELRKEYENKVCLKGKRVEEDGVGEAEEEWRKLKNIKLREVTLG